MRFGGALDATVRAGALAPHFESADVKLIADLRRLDEHHRQIAREFIGLLMRANQHR
ncbi:MAG: hypothetical protein ACI83P_000720 [Janthinobacterium sp.]